MRPLTNRGRQGAGKGYKKQKMWKPQKEIWGRRKPDVPENNGEAQLTFSRRDFKKRGRKKAIPKTQGKRELDGKKKGSEKEKRKEVAHLFGGRGMKLYYH